MKFTRKCLELQLRGRINSLNQIIQHREQTIKNLKLELEKIRSKKSIKSKEVKNKHD